MLRELKSALILFALLTLLTGVVYPAVVTAVAQGVFSRQANGSLIEGHGSRLLGQAFGQPRYFWGRPSATTPAPYNGAASSGSNLGVVNDALRKAVEERIAAFRAADPGDSRPVPVDLVLASASGLDPQISPAAAEFQVRRVARARGLTEQTVRGLVGAATESRTFGVLGEPRVNVLELNLALDAQKSN
jgi:K+-transporting ATPase ATPase C chain